MKRKLLILIGLFAMWLIFFAGAQIQTPVNTSVTTASWTAISLGANQSGTCFLARTRNLTPWKFSDSPTGTNYVSIDSGQAIAFDLNVPKGATLFYVQTIGSDDVIELFILR